MPGTQASLATRLEVLESELISPLVEHKQILIKALGQALETDSFGRPADVDTQGSRARLRDYHPNTREEVFDYWRAALRMLTTFACGPDENPLTALAREQIVRRINGLVRTPLIKEIDETINAVIESKGQFWEARKPILMAKNNLGPKLQDEHREIIDRLALLLEPRQMQDRIRIYVTEGSSNEVLEQPGEEEIDQGEQAAIALAEEFAREPDLWASNLLYLLINRQDYGYTFGYRMGEVIEDPQTFFTAMAAALLILPAGQADVSVIRGYVAAIHERDPGLVRAALELFAGNEKLRFYTVSLMFGMKLREEDLDRALKLVKDGHVNVLFLRNFAFFGRFSLLTPEQIMAFCDTLMEYGVEGAWAALDIYYMQLISHPDQWEIYKPKLREVVSFPGILSDPRSTSQMRTHNWSKTTERLLKENESGRDEELARFVANEIVATSASGQATYSVRNGVKPILPYLLREYRDVTWSTFSRALLRGEEERKSDLADILSSV